MKKICIILSIGLLFWGVVEIYAVPAPRTLHTVSQPDGTQITIQQNGDEFFRYITSADGYLLLKSEQGFYNYAKLSTDNTLVSTGVKAKDASERTKEEKVFLKALPSAEKSEENLIEIRTRNINRISSAQTLSTEHPVEGNIKSLVILVEYTDVKFATPNVRQAFTDMFNKQGYSDNKATGSVRDYFRDNSMGKFDPEFIVAGPYTLPEIMAYYGSNIPYDDANAADMIVDACLLAEADIDFTQFDNDGDGVVDNVSVIYAGYNEAESANLSNSVWPHHWQIGKDVFIQGKQIYSYLCTSELKGYKGSEMCGIGTFTHEFSHVLGLPDYYPTNYSEHHTLSDWNIMDMGSYLNDGRTPPSYSAFDRFYLGWLVPIELKGSQDVTLEPLPQSNKAYIITKDGNHNLNGADPQPTEFFTLENRQKTGWDTYLPGHGLLVTRINYNRSDWRNNSVNNSASRAGVKIMEADRISNEATLSGDPFPGTSNVTYYIPELRNKSLIENKRIHIQEQEGIIYLQYLESDGIPIPFALDPLSVTSDAFDANWEEIQDIDGYRFTAYSLSEGTSSFTESFDNGLDSVFGWHAYLEETTTNAQLSGTAAPAIQLNQPGAFLQTERYPAAVVELSFHLKTSSQTPITLILKGRGNSEWKQLGQYNITSQEGGGTNILFLNESDNYTCFHFELTSGSQAVIDDISASLAKRVEYAAREHFVPGGNSTFSVAELHPDLDYYYMLRASRIVDGKEEVSPFSNRIQVHTSQGSKSSTGIQVLSASNGKLYLYVSSGYIGKSLYLASVSGRIIARIPSIPSNFIEINNIPRQQIYIVYVGKSDLKIVMP